MTYQSSDFLTISALLFLKHRVVRVSKPDATSQRAVFDFQNSARLQADIERLNNAEVTGNIVDFYTAQQQAKRLIFEYSQP